MRYSISGTLDDFDYFRRPVGDILCACPRADAIRGSGVTHRVRLAVRTACGAKLPWPTGWKTVRNLSRTTTVTSKMPTTVTTHSIKAPLPVTGLVEQSIKCTDRLDQSRYNFPHSSG